MTQKVKEIKRKIIGKRKKTVKVKPSRGIRKEKDNRK
jgi:hypothetical protein